MVKPAMADNCVKKTLDQWGQLIPVSSTWNGSLLTLSIQDSCLIRTTPVFCEKWELIWSEFFPTTLNRSLETL